MGATLSNGATLPPTSWRDFQGTVRLAPFNANYSDPLPFETFQFFAECSLVGISVLVAKARMESASPAKSSREVRMIERRVVGEITRLVRDIKLAERDFEIGMRKEETVEFLAWKFDEARRMFVGVGEVVGEEMVPECDMVGAEGN
ncbi:hypothetical protein Q9L58_002665 [Maublancomyces gigas]|uniref:Uncharacterized protein n=1 Tax=Discina gigas TaxID=1032678 RepID=A0ABR3GQZ1_9PEZI